MCLAVPSRIIKIADNLMATVDVMGVRREVNLMLLPEEVKIGDFVLVHAGFAIKRVQEEIARDSLKFLNEISNRLENEDTQA